VTITELGSIGELVGGVATIATLAYLALQIRANTLATKRQSLDGIIGGVISWQARLTESPDLVRVWSSGQQGFSELSADDQLRFAALALEIFAVLEGGIEAGKFGDVKAESAEACRSLVGNLARSKGVSEWWETNGRNIMAADFVGEVDRISAEAAATNRGLPGLLPFLPVDSD
jgi:hypothetical protein